MALTRSTILAVIIGLSAQSAAAQEMRPISEILNVQPTQAFIRCAGLYSAIAAWAGIDRLGQETMDATESAMQTNLANAAVVYRNDGIGSTIEEAVQMAARDTNSAYELYIDRFSRNIAASGEAFGQDPLSQSDMELCGLITERFSN